MANFVERALIAPYYVNYHCEHHMFMHIPCYQLPKAHRLLGQKGRLAAHGNRAELSHAMLRLAAPA